MLSSALQQEIEAFAHHLREEHSLFSKARDGQLSAQAITRYLNNVLYLIQHTPVHLKLASQAAQNEGNAGLASYFEEKFREEQGHDEWARSDIRTLDERRSVAAVDDVSDHIRGLTGYLRRVIGKNPTAYVAYILLAEYLMVLLGEEWISSLEQGCDIPRDALSVVGNHVALDRVHATRGFEEVDGFLQADGELSCLRDTLRRSMTYMEEFFSEVAEAA